MAKFFHLAPLLFAALVLGGCDASDQSGQQPPPPAVDVAEVTSGPATLWGDFTGRVAAPESVELRPRVSGYINTVAFDEGELVQRGDLLFEIDPRPYRAREGAAVAQLKRARSELVLAKSQTAPSNFCRAVQFHKRNTIAVNPSWPLPKPRSAPPKRNSKVHNWTWSTPALPRRLPAVSGAPSSLAATWQVPTRHY